MANTNQISRIKAILASFADYEIDSCLDQQIQSGGNVCMQNSDSEEVINLLTKAQYINTLTAKGYSTNEAFRRLGSQIRELSAQKNIPTDTVFKRYEFTLR